MITRSILYFGEPMRIACDAKCAKAWGRNNRPRIDFDDHNPDDFAFLSDAELGEAPEDPGTYEGGQGKPMAPEERLNKWCCRECERCVGTRINDGVVQLPGLPDFSQRRYNIPARREKEHEKQKKAGEIALAKAVRSVVK